MKRFPGTKRLGRIKDALWRTVEAVPAKHTLQMAAALSYYFVISLFPALLLVSAIVAYLPGANPFAQVLSLMAGFVPQDSIELLRKVLATVVTPNRSTLLSFGILGTLWTASGGFAATIEALDIAYEVEEARPFWVTRPLAVGLTLLVGLLLLVALAVMIVGPQFGTWLALRTNLSWLLARVLALYSLDGCGASSPYWLLRPCISWLRMSASVFGRRFRELCSRWAAGLVSPTVGHLLPQLCPLQQDLRCHGGRNCLNGVALLDQLFHAGRSRTELPTG